MQDFGRKMNWRKHIAWKAMLSDSYAKARNADEDEEDDEEGDSCEENQAEARDRIQGDQSEDDTESKGGEEGEYCEAGE